MKKRQRSRCRWGEDPHSSLALPPGKSPRASPSLFARGYPVQALLVLEDEQAALVREQSVALHLVDQGRDERAGRADEVGEVLLGDPVQAKLVSRRDPLAVRLGEGDEHLGEAGRNVLP